MGWTFRKSFRLFGPFRINLSRGGIGVSAGVKGARISAGPTGTRITLSKAGLQYRKQLKNKLWWEFWQ